MSKRIEFGPFRETLLAFIEAHGESNIESLRDRVDGRHFSELLLMSLIRGNRLRVIGTNQRAPDTDFERLSRAHEAVFGNTPSQFANNRDDERALNWMAEMKESQECLRSQDPKAPRPDSATKLAKRAFELFSKHPQDDDAEFRRTRPHMSSPDHLRKKFPAYWEDWQKRGESRDLRDDVRLLQRAALEELEIILRLFGVESYAEE